MAAAQNIYTQGFSIDWSALNPELDMTPVNLVNEVRRLTHTPPTCTVADFINFYLARSIATQEDWQKHLLKVCACFWIKKAAMQWPHEDLEQKMNEPIQEAWNKFCESVDRLPDDDTSAGC